MMRYRHHHPMVMGMGMGMGMAFFSPKLPFSSSIHSSLSDVLNRREWMLPSPSTHIHKVSLKKELGSGSFSCSNDPNPNLLLPGGREEAGTGPGLFYVVRDDLLHPLVNGNKSRKLDALLPILQRHSATHVVSCGGCQSAHAAALAVSCAERGIKSHLLLRGEQPEIPTGYNLVSLMYGNVTYVPRSIYKHREQMLHKHAIEVAASDGCVVRVDDILGSTSEARPEESSRKVVIVSEGAGDVVGLLVIDLLTSCQRDKIGEFRVSIEKGRPHAPHLGGVIRLVSYLSQAHVFGKEQQINIVVDAGTGTTAIGLALGALYLGLPWKVTAVMLADTLERYKAKEKSLITNFTSMHQSGILKQTTDRADEGIVHWVERAHPRRFGKVLKGEIELCRNISMQTGILLDPVYTLAAWEQSSLLSLSECDKGVKVVMLHTGGTLGLFGLAQRYSSYFQT